MKHITYLFLLLVLLSSCQRNNLQTISKEVLSKELTEVQADSGLVILIKDNEIAAKVNLISDNGIYKEGDELSFQTKRDMGTLLSTACMMAALDCISPTDTVDVGAGIYLKDGNLTELFTVADSQASASAGTSISQLSDFQAENLDNGFYRISLKSATGISAHFLLHSTAESSVTGTDAGKKEAS